MTPPPIYLLALWLQIHRKSAEQTDEGGGEMERGGEGRQRFRYSLWAVGSRIRYHVTDKELLWKVDMLRRRGTVMGAGIMRLCMCMCALVHVSGSLRFVSKTWDFLCEGMSDSAGDTWEEVHGMSVELGARGGYWPFPEWKDPFHSGQIKTTVAGNITGTLIY